MKIQPDVGQTWDYLPFVLALSPIYGKWFRPVTKQPNFYNHIVDHPIRYHASPVFVIPKILSVLDSIYYTDPAPPSTYPRNLRGGGGKVSTLVMEWDPLPPAEHNGEGLRYIVHWKINSVAEQDKWEHVRTGSDCNYFKKLVNRYPKW